MRELAFGGTVLRSRERAVIVSGGRRRQSVGAQQLVARISQCRVDQARGIGCAQRCKNNKMHDNTRQFVTTDVTANSPNVPAFPRASN